MPTYDLEPRTAPEPDPEYSPIRQPARFADLGRRLAAAVVVVGGLVLKFGLAGFKFFGIFLAVGGYALIWGWRFAVGFVALIAIHELGHYVEARRQGLRPSLPVFIPFLGAYVAIKNAPFDPWRNALVSIAGPIVGGVGALAVLVTGDVLDSQLLQALGYTAFLLNLFNLVPFLPLDGGHIWQSLRILRHGTGAPSPAAARSRAWAVGALYVGTAVALALGMVAAHVPQDRL